MLMTITKQEKRLMQLKKSCIGLLGLAILGFVGVKMYPLFHGPDIQISTLSDGATLHEAMIRISGKARYTKDLMIDGAVLPTAPDGSFDEKLVLNPGYNVIAVSAKDRFGTTRHTTYSVILHEEKDQTFTMDTAQIKTN